MRTVISKSDFKFLHSNIGNCIVEFTSKATGKKWTNILYNNEADEVLKCETPSRAKLERLLKIVKHG